MDSEIFKDLVKWEEKLTVLAKDDLAFLNYQLPIWENKSRYLEDLNRQFTGSESNGQGSINPNKFSGVLRVIARQTRISERKCSGVLQRYQAVETEFKQISPILRSAENQMKIPQVEIDEIYSQLNACKLYYEDFASKIKGQDELLRDDMVLSDNSKFKELMELVGGEGNLLEEHLILSRKKVILDLFHAKKLSTHLRANDNLGDVQVVNKPPTTQYFVPMEIRNMPYLGGIVIMHGLGGKRSDINYTARVLAHRGFFVVSVDIPGHHDHKAKFGLAQMSKTIMSIIKFMRREFNPGFKVCVIGHSMGAIGTMFSAFGYDSEVENALEQIWNEYTQAISNNSPIPDSIASTMSQVIEESMKRNEEGIPNFFILTGPPLDFLSVVPKIVQQVLPLAPDSVGKIFLKNTILRDKNGKSRKKELAKYFTGAKVPLEYFGLLNELGSMNQYIKTSVEEYQRIPKLVIYGEFDILARPWWGKKVEIIKKFLEIGSEPPIFLQSTGHWMAKEDSDTVGKEPIYKRWRGFENDAIDALLIDRVNIAIFNFLEKHFGKDNNLAE